METLEAVVRAIYDVICRTEFHVASQYSQHPPDPAGEDRLRHLRGVVPPVAGRRSARAREPDLRGAPGGVRLGIGAELPDGQPHDGRAPDYDDWTTPRPDGGRGLNGDILLWNPVLGRAFEISSMGIRVDPETLGSQLEIRGLEDAGALPFHRMLLAGELPQTMGGGIGQSRMCMFFLRTAHVGEVSVGIWPEAMQKACAAAGIPLL